MSKYAGTDLMNMCPRQPKEEEHLRVYGAPSLGAKMVRDALIQPRCHLARRHRTLVACLTSGMLAVLLPQPAAHGQEDECIWPVWCSDCVGVVWKVYQTHAGDDQGAALNFGGVPPKYEECDSCSEPYVDDYCATWQEESLIILDLPKNGCQACNIQVAAGLFMDATENPHYNQGLCACDDNCETGFTLENLGNYQKAMPSLSSPLLKISYPGDPYKGVFYVRATDEVLYISVFPPVNPPSQELELSITYKASKLCQLTTACEDVTLKVKVRFKDNVPCPLDSGCRGGVCPSGGIARPSLSAGRALFVPNTYDDGGMSGRFGCMMGGGDPRDAASGDFFFKINGYPELSSGSLDPFIYSYMDAITYVDLGGGNTKFTLTAEVRMKTPPEKYFFASDRIGTHDQYNHQTQWGGAFLPLEKTQIKSGGDWVNTVTGLRTEVGGATRSEKWCEANDLSNCIYFGYDGARRMTSAHANGKTLSMTYAQYTTTGTMGNIANTYVLSELSSTCESCPDYDYEYDGTRLTLVTDSNDTTLVGYEYDGSELTKKYRKTSTGNEQLMYEADYDEDTYTITHKTYHDNGNKEVRVEKYDKFDIGDDAYTWGKRTANVYYPKLNPSIGSDPTNVFSYVYEYDEGAELTRLKVLFPQGNERWDRYAEKEVGIRELIIRSVYDGVAEITTAEYDYVGLNDRNHILWAVDVRGSTTDYDYQWGGPNDGLLISTEYPSVTVVRGGSVQQILTYEYDQSRRMTQQSQKATDNSKVHTDYDYDAVGNVTTVVEDAAGIKLTTSYEYDKSNRLTKATDPRGVVRKTAYTGAGSLDKEYTLELGGSDAESYVEYDYDDLGRLTKRAVANSDSPVSPTSPGDLIDSLYLYDPFGRRTGVVEDAGGLNLTTKYEYDNQDRVVKTTTTGGVYTRTIRDGQGRRVTQLVGYSGGSELTTIYAYDGNSNLTGLTRPGGIVTTYEYDGYDQQTRVIRGG